MNDTSRCVDARVCLEKKKKKELDGLKVEMKVSFCICVVHFITGKSADTPKKKKNPSQKMKPEYLCGTLIDNTYLTIHRLHRLPSLEKPSKASS